MLAGDNAFGIKTKQGGKIIVAGIVNANAIIANNPKLVAFIQVKMKAPVR